jgi:membrane associated rhomboid family serine protease
MLGAMSSPWPKPSAESWFRVGRLEITTVMFVILITVASWVAWVIYPPMAQAFAFIPAPTFSGQLWRLATWPLADGLSFIGVLNLFFFWYIGTELEGQIGRRRMAWFLGGVWLALTLAAVVIGLVAPAAVALFGVGLIEFAVLLVWVAENPRRPLFFGIPAWVFGAVLLGIEVLTLMAGRGWGTLLSLLLGLLGVALVAKRQGLLAGVAMVPGKPRAPRPARRTASARAEQHQSAKRAADRARLDVLLDRINETGLHSLTDAERKELVDLRNRLRGDR